MSRSNTFVSTVVFAVVVAVVAMSGSNQQRVDAFAPGPVAQRTHHGAGVVNSQIVNVKTLKMAFFNDEEPKKLTRESEPEEFFSTNTDKMSDEEKIPIAVVGLIGISAPFILGLIALYAARY
mmetsp:Transcript_16416/g.40050  ORF Transcript_16416/g.40050 Transcript_16416/m.40050 type:complete len:122 (+) Transcript_16416:161-526(+)|eukprot:CAMPEP_0113481340 /NCGR_PEP_ID=MMETSP0014_2-20120614/22358_1 /TAXON_ID=2857 /ORGANISM="Nitzschia sp." /LENGTH=121 /DNA_ID=CAMNT_0000374833 /DNA_START=161 /DNA_END=526 /DNA_ORIENTATION=- /assembly_acc=CAM_ASM_000159